jgi:selenocysteine lyase/cysteine desulfurase
VEDMLFDVRTFVAERINCKPQNVFLVENGTDGINCIMKSFNWKEGDVVLLPNTAYPCIRKTITSLKDRYNVTILDVHYFL